MCTCRVIDILWALQKIEAAFFASSLGAKAKNMPFVPLEHKKDLAANKIVQPTSTSYTTALRGK